MECTAARAARSIAGHAAGAKGARENGAMKREASTYLSNVEICAHVGKEAESIKPINYFLFINNLTKEI
jgi:hypothetical protein